MQTSPSDLLQITSIFLEDTCTHVCTPTFTVTTQEVGPDIPWF